MMTELQLDDTQLLAAIDALKRVSPEQQEAAILRLEEEHPGIGERIRALLAIEKQAAEHIARVEKPRVEPKAIEPVKSAEPVKSEVVRKVRYKHVGQAWFKSINGGEFIRHIGPLPKEVEAKLSGVPQLKVVDQAKPK